jgi:small-conductance mechanosensitive channel
MKRILFYMLLFTGVVTVITGIAEAGRGRHGQPHVHLAFAVLFVALCIIHIVMQRKAVWRYLTWAVKLPSDPRQKRRQVMRRITVYLMLVFGLLSIIGAVLESGDRGRPVFHIVMALVFVLFLARHVLANRKAAMNYLAGRKKEPAPATTLDIEDAAD